jgi:predicted AlkP superfamily pyrophosphatase or phosphodiesterase
MSKVILVVCDALRDDVAEQYMGYLEHLVETRRATRYSVIGELPSMSRPVYETLHTGVTCSEHGITNNAKVRRSNMPNVFQSAREAGLVTAASAFCWYSELYNRAPYDIINDREVDDESLNIQHGRFYREDGYSDIEVFAAGAMLARRFNPDYLLIHPMMIDVVGEAYGADSPQYRKQVITQDQIMANLVPEALAVGYTMLITADHGMSDDNSTHGGTLPQMRNVPLYIIKPGMKGEGKRKESISQLRIAPTLLQLLGVAIPDTMQALPIPI